MLNQEGSPQALRLGLGRYISVYAIPDEHRQLPISQMIELIRDGSQLVYQVSAEIAASIWRNWPSGFSQRSDQGPSPWLDALFEISWQRPRGGPGHAERFAWHENASIALVGNGLFPRLPSSRTSSLGEVVANENGYPRAFYSKLPDVARASVAAIDEILECSTSLTTPRKTQSMNTGDRSAAKGSGRSVRDFSSFCEGDIDPTLNKRIRVLIDSGRKYIVYLDQDLSVEHSWTEAYGKAPRGFAGIATEVSRLELLSGHVLDRPWAEGFRRLVGEGMARIIGDRSARRAQAALRIAESYLQARVAEELGALPGAADHPNGHTNKPQRQFMKPTTQSRVFISHSSKDKPFVRKLVTELKKHQLNVWFDEQEINVGDSIVSRISGGLRDADYLVVVLSESSVASPWVQAELNSALMDQISGQGTAVLPVLIENCDIPPLLRDRLYADFRKDFTTGFAKLLSVLEQEGETAAELGVTTTTTTTRPLGATPCAPTLAALSLGELRRRITKRMGRSEVAAIWFDLFQTKMEDDMAQRPLVDCVIELLDRANKRAKLSDVIVGVCADRSDLANP
jgi:hypothetical protein